MNHLCFSGMWCYGGGRSGMWCYGGGRSGM